MGQAVNVGRSLKVKWREEIVIVEVDVQLFALGQRCNEQLPLIVIAEQLFSSGRLFSTSPASSFQTVGAFQLSFLAPPQFD
jgi:hypothetical protein